jgi:poly(3-hydroxybutyrate) depolymerase
MRTLLNNRYRFLWLPLLLAAARLHAASILQFSAVSYTVAENGGAATVVVQRTNDLNAAVGVDYATTDGTASAGSDYTKVSGTLNFAAGETNKSFNVPILNDALVEPTETFQVILSNPTGGAVLGTRATVTVRITDNDRGVQVEIPTYSVTEDAGSIAVAVIRGSDENLPATVDFATVDGTAKAGQDYIETKGRLDFAANERRKLVSIPILNDALRESSKTFRFILSNPAGATSLGKSPSATITIKDNDPGISFSQAIYTVSEDAGEARVTVLRGNDVDTPAFTVDYAATNGTAVADADYEATSDTLSFAAAEMSKVFTVPILNNAVRQASRTVQIRLSNPTAGLVLGNQATAIIRILDNDPGVGFEHTSYSVWRNAGDVTVTILRGNDGAFGKVAVDYATVDSTAKAGQDYQAVSGTVEFTENETIKSLTIPILTNASAVDTKRFRLTLRNPTGGVELGVTNATVEMLSLRVAANNVHTVAPAFDPALAIGTRHSDLNVLNWIGAGVLQKADTVTGPWQTLSNALGFATIQRTTPAGFFRIAHPRPASLFVPSTYDVRKPLPLVILLHGYGGDSAGYQDYMRLAPLAEQKGFLYCFPDGTFDSTGSRFWNATDACCDFFEANPDDAGYLRGLIEEIGKRFAVDGKRICLMGHSNGGFMSYRMACQHSDLIAAIASLAGMTFLQPESCAPSAPVNVLHIHGTADAVVPYGGTALGTATGFPADAPPFPGALQTVANWARYNSCRDPITETERSLDLDLDVPGLDTVVTRYTSFPPGGAVELWTIVGGSHGPTFFSGNSASEFSGRVIDWLLAHPKP